MPVIDRAITVAATVGIYVPLEVPTRFRGNLVRYLGLPSAPRSPLRPHGVSPG